MNEDDTLQRQLADIGTRYLKRTLSEIAELRACLQEARQGSTEATKQLGRMAHKIHGSGAMFGFDKLSERAHEIEQLAASAHDEAALVRVEEGVSALEREVREQASLRGVE
jgi:HPt (histidine-containing phosphotransfer) domain-containing protein